MHLVDMNLDVVGYVIFRQSLFAKLWKAAISFVMAVRPSVCLSAWNNSAPTWQIFMKFYIWTFFENLSRKLKFL